MGWLSPPRSTTAPGATRINTGPGSCRGAGLSPACSPAHSPAIRPSPLCGRLHRNGGFLRGPLASGMIVSIAPFGDRPVGVVTVGPPLAPVGTVSGALCLELCSGVFPRTAVLPPFSLRFLDYSCSGWDYHFGQSARRPHSHGLVSSRRLRSPVWPDLASSPMACEPYRSDGGGVAPSPKVSRACANPHLQWILNFPGSGPASAAK